MCFVPQTYDPLLGQQTVVKHRLRSIIYDSTVQFDILHLRNILSIITHGP